MGDRLMARPGGNKLSRSEMATTKIKAYSAKQAGLKMNLPHLEIIRRLRKGDIEGSKLGWVWIITEDAIEKAMASEWYKQYIK